MKVSRTVKTSCYVCINLGILIWSTAFLIGGASFQRSIVVCICSLVGMNVLLWFMFRLKEKGRL
jgi:hypothetical protein